MTKFTIEFQSKYLLRKTEVLVYIPGQSLQETIKQSDKNQLEKSNKTYPLMILLPGFGSNKSAWVENTNVVELAQKYQVALALISGENKWYMNFSPIDNWEGFLNYELPDFLYGTFKELSSSNPRYLVGCSMGGYGALRNYLTHSELYKACAALSPATYADNNLEAMLKAKSLRELAIDAKDIKKNIYLSVGTEDFIAKASKEFDEFLKENNCGFGYSFIDGYDHSYRLWNEEIKKVFEYIMKLS